MIRVMPGLGTLDSRATGLRLASIGPGRFGQNIGALDHAETPVSTEASLAQAIKRRLPTIGWGGAEHSANGGVH